MNRDFIIVLGKTGFGKSVMSRKLSADQTRLLVYDPTVSYNVEYTSGEDIYDKVIGHGNGASFGIGENSDDTKKKYRLGVFDPDDIPRLGSIAFASGNNMLLLEEASTVWPKGARLDEWAKRLVFLGRHRRVDMLVVAQRPSSIPIDVRSQANQVISFQQHEADDLGWLKEFYGQDAKELSKLPKFTCLHYNNGEVYRYSIEKEWKKYQGTENDVELDTAVEASV